jgi:hypothetical protein
MIHFTYGDDFDEKGEFTPGKVGHWHWDKRDYTVGARSCHGSLLRLPPLPALFLACQPLNARSSSCVSLLHPPCRCALRLQGKYPPRNFPMPPEGCTNECVKELIRRVNEAADNLPRWAEFEAQLFTPAAAAGVERARRRTLAMLRRRPEPLAAVAVGGNRPGVHL